MNRIDHEIDKVGRQASEATVQEQIDAIRAELVELYEKARAGTAVQGDSDRYTELVYRLRELEA